MNNNKSFAKNTAILLISMVLTKIIGAVLKIPLTNMLGGVGMGYYSAAFSIFMPVYAVLSAGIPTVVTKLVAQNVKKRCYRSIRQIKSAALTISLVAGILGTFFVVAFSKPFAFFFVSEPESVYAIIAIAPCILFCCVAAVYKGYYEGLSDMLPTGISQIVEAVVKAILGLLLAYITLSYCISRNYTIDEAVPYAAAASMLGITFGEFSATLYLIIRYKKHSDGITASEIKRSPLPPKTKATIKSILSSALPISLGAAAGSLGSLIDMLTMPAGITATALTNPGFFIEKYGIADISQIGTFVYGSYTGIVLTLFVLITSITAIIGKSIFPEIASCCNKNNKIELLRNIKILFYGIFTVGLPMCFLMGTYSYNILKLLFSQRIQEISVCTEPLAIISFGGIFIALTGGLFVVFQAIGRNDIPIKLIMLNSIIRLGCNMLLISFPQTAVNAASISTTVSFFIICLIGMMILKNKLYIKIELIAIFAKPFTAAAASSIAGLFCMNIINNNNNTLSLIISGGVSCAVYASLIFILDRKVILSYYNRYRQSKRKYSR